MLKLAKASMLRPATDDDWQVFTGLPAPREWFGLVYATDALIHGLGGAYVGTDGRWWATFRRAPGVGLRKTAHVAAVAIMRGAAERGLALHALADDRIDGACSWLRRLGFEETDEQIEGYPVWVRK